MCKHPFLPSLATCDPDRVEAGAAHLCALTWQSVD
jgi:hypothetical protein